MVFKSQIEGELRTNTEIIRGRLSSVEGTGRDFGNSRVRVVGKKRNGEPFTGVEDLVRESLEHFGPMVVFRSRIVDNTVPGTEFKGRETGRCPKLRRLCRGQGVCEP